MTDPNTKYSTLSWAIYIKHDILMEWYMIYVGDYCEALFIRSWPGAGLGSPESGPHLSS